MKMPIRWLKEKCKPELKCSRLGHKWVQIVLYGYQYPAKNPFNHVADLVKLTIHQCKRCGKMEKMDDDDVLKREGVHSLEMDEWRWEKLKMDGFIKRI